MAITTQRIHRSLVNRTGGRNGRIGMGRIVGGESFDLGQTGDGQAFMQPTDARVLTAVTASRLRRMMPETAQSDFRD